MWRFPHRNSGKMYARAWVKVRYGGRVGAEK